MESTRVNPLVVSAVVHSTGDITISIVNPTYEQVTKIFFGVVNDTGGLTNRGPVPPLGPAALESLQQLAVGLTGLSQHAQEVLQNPVYNLTIGALGHPVNLTCEYLQQRLELLIKELQHASDGVYKTTLEAAYRTVLAKYEQEGCNKQDE